MKGMARGALTGMVCMGMVLATAPAPARAAIIGTEQMVTTQARTDDLATVNAFMQRQDVVAEMEKLGVNPTDAQDRVASLSNEELSQLAQNINEQPAGGDGLFVVLGVVFLVLVILELVGVTHIFSSF
ncbi:PA2779 family protein [Solimonas marina]|uniref:PA2779 family protein n=1 Tax=Solimonas marina TaxID=2714601 RepID=A0A969WDC5_9GAMM|nr:PA2779 family protein [Solimonas marina]NKF23928.1 PA2779 family protein [Solimonas marina]